VVRFKFSKRVPTDSCEDEPASFQLQEEKEHWLLKDSSPEYCLSDVQVR